MEIQRVLYTLALPDGEARVVERVTPEGDTVYATVHSEGLLDPMFFATAHEARLAFNDVLATYDAGYDQGYNDGTLGLEYDELHPEEDTKEGYNDGYVDSTNAELDFCTNCDDWTPVEYGGDTAECQRCKTTWSVTDTLRNHSLTPPERRQPVGTAKVAGADESCECGCWITDNDQSLLDRYEAGTMPLGGVSWDRDVCEDPNCGCHNHWMRPRSAAYRGPLEGWNGPVFVQERRNNGSMNGNVTTSYVMHINRHRMVGQNAVEYPSEQDAVDSRPNGTIFWCSRCVDAMRAGSTVVAKTALREVEPCPFCGMHRTDMQCPTVDDKSWNDMMQYDTTTEWRNAERKKLRDMGILPMSIDEMNRNVQRPAQASRTSSYYRPVTIVELDPGQFWYVEYEELGFAGREDDEDFDPEWDTEWGGPTQRTGPFRTEDDAADAFSEQYGNPGGYTVVDQENSTPAEREQYRQVKENNISNRRRRGSLAAVWTTEDFPDLMHLAMTVQEAQQAAGTDERVWAQISPSHEVYNGATVISVDEAKGTVKLQGESGVQPVLPLERVFTQAELDAMDDEDDSIAASKIAGSWWGEDPEDNYDPGDSQDPIKAWECPWCTARNPEYTAICQACHKCEDCGKVIPANVSSYDHSVVCPARHDSSRRTARKYLYHVTTSVDLPDIQARGLTVDSPANDWGGYVEPEPGIHLDTLANAKEIWWYNVAEATRNQHASVVLLKVNIEGLDVEPHYEWPDGEDDPAQQVGYVVSEDIPPDRITVLGDPEEQPVLAPTYAESEAALTALVAQLPEDQLQALGQVAAMGNNIRSADYESQIRQILAAAPDAMALVEQLQAGTLPGVNRVWDWDQIPITMNLNLPKKYRHRDDY